MTNKKYWWEYWDGSMAGADIVLIRHGRALTLSNQKFEFYIFLKQIEVFLFLTNSF
jgi:hypothetical protein